MSGIAITSILRPLEEVEHRWNESRHAAQYAGCVTFRQAPGDHGTEVSIHLGKRAPAGVLGQTVTRIAGAGALAKAKDDLRRFKQLVETGVIARSDAVPDGEHAERKLKQRPAQPLGAEHERVGV